MTENFPDTARNELPVGKELAWPQSPVIQCYLWGRSWRCPSPQSCSVTCGEGAGVVSSPQSCSVTCGEGAGVVSSHAVLPVGKELALPQSPAMQCYLWIRSWRCPSPQSCSVPAESYVDYQRTVALCQSQANVES